MPAFVGSAIAHGTGTGPFAPDFSGTGWAADDYAIAFCFKAEDAVDFTAPSDLWFPLYYNYGSGDGRTAKIFYKKLVGGDTTSPSFTVTGGSNPTSVMIAIFEDVDVSNPFDAFSLLELVTNDATPTPGSVTTVTADALAALWMGSYLDTSMSGGAPSGYTLRADYTGSTYDDRQQILADKSLGAAGTETPGDWTNSASPGNTEDGLKFSLALRDPEVDAVYPVVENAVLTNSTVATTSHAFGTPASIGCNADDLELSIFVCRAGSTPSLTGLRTGFTRIDGDISSVSGKRMYVAYRKVTGDETFTTVTTSTATYAVYHRFRITGWNESYPPIMVETAGQDVGAVSPVNSRVLFIAAFGNSGAIRGGPSGYNWQRTRSSPGGATWPVLLHTSLRERLTNSENPGAWNPFSTGDDWAAVIAVPKGPTGGVPGGTEGVGSGWGISI